MAACDLQFWPGRVGRCQMRHSDQILAKRMGIKSDPALPLLVAVRGCCCGDRRASGLLLFSCAADCSQATLADGSSLLELPVGVEPIGRPTIWSSTPTV